MDYRKPAFYPHPLCYLCTASCAVVCCCDATCSCRWRVASSLSKYIYILVVYHFLRTLYKHTRGNTSCWLLGFIMYGMNCWLLEYRVCDCQHAYVSIVVWYNIHGVCGLLANAHTVADGCIPPSAYCRKVWHAGRSCCIHLVALDCCMFPHAHVSYGCMMCWFHASCQCHCVYVRINLNSQPILGKQYSQESHQQSTVSHL